MIARGDIYIGDVGEVTDSGPAKIRPVVVVSADTFNFSRIATVVVATITSNTALATRPGNVFLPAALSGLHRDSVINTSQLWTIDKRYFGRPAGRAPQAVMEDVDRSLRHVLGLY